MIDIKDRLRELIPIFNILLVFLDENFAGKDGVNLNDV
jgi:hypothetical protein